jgi:hypothetical protein
VQFLRDGPPPLPEPHEPDERRTPRLLLGEIAGRLVRLDTLAWSADAIDLEVIVRGPDGRADPEVGVPWQARVLDDRGHVHLGQPAVLRGGAGRLRFALRPGVGPGVNRLDLRVTRGGARLEGSVAL